MSRAFKEHRPSRNSKHAFGTVFSSYREKPQDDEPVGLNMSSVTEMLKDKSRVCAVEFEGVAQAMIYTPLEFSDVNFEWWS